MSTVSFNPDHTMIEALRAAEEAGGRATLHLSGGDSLQGRVSGVGDHHVVLNGITGRDFFDAFVVIDRIVAVEAQARTS